MTEPHSTSLIERAGLDRDDVRKEIVRGLEGADDGELFMEYRQSEGLAFDNGRLKQATYDTAQGFGLRAVKDDAVGYAHSSDMSLSAIARAVKRLLDAGYPLEGASDHGVSEAIYLRDPDGNGVELYRDRAREEWPVDAAGKLAMVTRRLDLRGLVAEAG